MLKSLSFILIFFAQALVFSQVNEQEVSANLIKKNKVISHRLISIEANSIDTSSNFYYFNHGGISYHKDACIIIGNENSEYKKAKGCELTEYIYNSKNQLIEILQSSYSENSSDRQYTNKQTLKYNNDGFLEIHKVYQPADDKAPQIRYYYYSDSLKTSEIIYWQVYNDSIESAVKCRVDSTVYMYNDSKTAFVAMDYRDSELTSKWSLMLARPSDTCYFEYYDFLQNKGRSAYFVYDEIGRVITSHVKLENIEETYYHNYYPNGLPMEWGKKGEKEDAYKNRYIYDYKKD